MKLTMMNRQPTIDRILEICTNETAFTQQKSSCNRIGGGNDAATHANYFKDWLRTAINARTLSSIGKAPSMVGWLELAAAAATAAALAEPAAKLGALAFATSFPAEAMMLSSISIKPR
jgi:hypothetical protein